MDKENEVINGYEIIESMYVGENEVIIAENHNENGNKYLCGYYESNELFARINAICTSNSYPDIVIAFCDNVKEQAEKRKEQIIDGIGVITNDMCAAIDENEKLIGKVIVLKPSVLRREYRYADSQLFYCTGGNGAMPNAIGTKVYGFSLSTGKELYVRRYDILGTIDKNNLPEWAKVGLANIQQSEKAKDRGER
jgi:hypothetical protein